MQGKPINKKLKGRKFGNLQVVGLVGKRGSRWLCKCDCGEIKEFYTSDLLTRHNVSCGCMSGKQAFKHGFASGEALGQKRHRFYRIWDGIRSRVYNKSDPSYKRYGGRGIKCDWKDILEFKKDMYKSYLEHVSKFGESNTQIERINNDGDYSKKNCKWATREEQGRNRCDNVYVTYKGKKMTVVEYAQIMNIEKSTIYGRIKRGWDNKRVISEEVQTKFASKK